MEPSHLAGRDIVHADNLVAAAVRVVNPAIVKYRLLVIYVPLKKPQGTLRVLKEGSRVLENSECFYVHASSPVAYSLIQP